jgi:uncharacterized membrane-anchored protein YhcB (DUF1043 family)
MKGASSGMKPTTSGIKNKAYLIIISAFVIGVVTGVLLMNLVAARSSANKRLAPLDELSSELQLDQSQKDQVEKTFQEFHQRNRELLQPIQPQLTDLRLQTRMKIRGLLRSDQQSRFDELNQKRDAEREKKGQGQK